MGVIFDIQRCCYHDGPGIRTTVFFKGCPLRCAWCHNPESFQKEPQLRYLDRSCVFCRRCQAACPQGVHSFEGDAHRVDFSKCTGCGACVRACPSHALELVGREVTPGEILETVKRDAIYYASTGGGMTVSGGEPTLQPEFLEELLTLAKAAGIHTCLETNGYIPEAVLHRIAPLTDLFLIDYKLSQDEGLKAHTLASGPLWERTVAYLAGVNKPVWLRLPVIPGINDTDAHFARAAAFAKRYANIGKLEIMPYHSIGKDKWRQLGLSYTLEALPSATEDQKALWNEMLKAALSS